MKKGKKNKVCVAPEQGKGLGLMAHNELEGELIAEKAVSQAQQRFMGMVYAAKKGEKPASPEVAKAAEGMSKKEAKKFAKTKHEGLPEKVKEEMECGSDDKKKKNGEEEDTRSMKTKVNIVKNKLRAMGLKMSYEPEGEVLDELNRAAKERGEKSGGDPAIAARNKPPFKYGGSRQQPKNRGEKPPSPSEQATERGVLSPLEHKVALRRAARKRAAEFEMDTKGT
jgi:hypothetical protein